VKVSSLHGLFVPKQRQISSSTRHKTKKPARPGVERAVVQADDCRLNLDSVPVLRLTTRMIWTSLRLRFGRSLL